MSATKEVPTWSLEGKVALVTGSGRGIGKSMAIELARRGADVVVNYANSSEAADSVVKEIEKLGRKSIAIKANVANVDETVKMFEEAKKAMGKLDIVSSNSGVVSFGHMKDVTPEEFDRVFNINTRGQFFVAREAYKHLEIGGRIILMGSITGQAKGFQSTPSTLAPRVPLRPSPVASPLMLVTRRSQSTASPQVASRLTCTTLCARSISQVVRR